MHFMQAKRLADGDGVTHPGLWPVRRHHNDLTEVFYRFHKVHDAGRRYSVVIGDQDYRLLSLSADFNLGWFFWAFRGLLFCFCHMQRKSDTFFLDIKAIITKAVVRF
jgi:hypothetical protein